jgi:hypothetical protein
VFCAKQAANEAGSTSITIIMQSCFSPTEMFVTTTCLIIRVPTPQLCNFPSCTRYEIAMQRKSFLFNTGAAVYKPKEGGGGGDYCVLVKLLFFGRRSRLRMSSTPPHERVMRSRIAACANVAGPSVRLMV